MLQLIIDEISNQTVNFSALNCRINAILELIIIDIIKLKSMLTCLTMTLAV